MRLVLRSVSRTRPLLAVLLCVVLALGPLGCFGRGGTGTPGAQPPGPAPSTPTPGPATPGPSTPGPTAPEPAPPGAGGAKAPGSYQDIYPWSDYDPSWVERAVAVPEGGSLKVTVGDREPVYFRQPGAYTPAAVRATLAPYTAAPDLSNVQNIKSFPGLSPEQRAYLAQNLFFAAPTQDQQLFFVYDSNKYSEVPSFYTADLFLQLYHLIYDYALRDMEGLFALPELEELTLKMLSRSLADGSAAAAPLVKSAAVKNAAYFAVAAGLLEIPAAQIPALPEAARALADQEAALIAAHQGRTHSAIFPHDLDYSQFIPRGHYTRTPELERYFKAMMWYGLAPFPARSVEGARADEQLVQALLMARGMEDPDLAAGWEGIYEPTTFFVGGTDDLNLLNCRRMMEAIYGKNPAVDALADGARLDRLVAEMDKPENQPRIKQVLVGIPTGVQFRFMGQRYLPDSEILQELSNWPARPLPKGLDVPGVLGSARAEDLLFNLYREPQAWPDYAVKFPQLRQEFAALPQDAWRSNLYYGWLWALQPLLEKKAAGMPSFMLTQGWPSKELETYLGSWSELRHDTILYGKAMAAEAGDGLELVPQYVEPLPEFYNRLAWLANRAGYGLAQRGLLSQQMALILADFRGVLEFVRGIALKELAGETPDEDDLWRLEDLGGVIERLSIRTIGPYGHWGNLLSEAEKHMAVIADIGTSAGTCLEVGVGPAKHVYVIFPFGGKLFLGRGAMFTYHEFLQPIADRLTDEAWREMVKAGKAPPQQEWIRAYTIGQPLEPKPPAQ